jgi:hypothetical protein
LFFVLTRRCVEEKLLQMRYFSVADDAAHALAGRGRALVLKHSRDAAADTWGRGGRTA